MDCRGVTATRVLSLMVFWGQIQNYMMRVSISILIVAMIKPQQQDLKTSASNSTSSALNSTSIDDHAYCQVPESALGPGINST